MPNHNLRFNKLGSQQQLSAKLTLMPVMALGLILMAACTPTVQVAMPSEPITINLNVRIEHEIRIRVERELDEMFSENSGLF